MNDGHYFLAIYVLFNRAKFDELLLVGLPARQRFEKGLLVLPVLQQRMKTDRVAQARAEGIMKSLPHYFDDAFEAAANHEP